MYKTMQGKGWSSCEKALYRTSSTQRDRTARDGAAVRKPYTGRRRHRGPHSKGWSSCEKALYRTSSTQRDRTARDGAAVRKPYTGRRRGHRGTAQQGMEQL
ncbi:hypothetical protein STEG23_014580 [Scotinomys teguina]